MCTLLLFYAQSTGHNFAQV